MIVFLLKNWKLLAALGVCLVCFTAGVKVESWRSAAALHAAEVKAEKQRQALSDKAAKLTEELSHAETNIHTVYRDRVKTIYRYRGPARCIDDDGLRFIEQWNQIAGQTGKPDAAVPAGDKRSGG